MGAAVGAGLLREEPGWGLLVGLVLITLSLLTVKARAIDSPGEGSAGIVGMPPAANAERPT